MTKNDGFNSLSKAEKRDFIIMAVAVSVALWAAICVSAWILSDYTGMTDKSSKAVFTGCMGLPLIAYYLLPKIAVGVLKKVHPEIEEEREPDLAPVEPEKLREKITKYGKLGVTLCFMTFVAIGIVIGIMVETHGSETTPPELIGVMLMMLAFTCLAHICFKIDEKRRKSQNLP